MTNKNQARTLFDIANDRVEHLPTGLIIIIRATDDPEALRGIVAKKGKANSQQIWELIDQAIEFYQARQAA
jgi:hypothetical protein